jgi:hypothetical protein
MLQPENSEGYLRSFAEECMAEYDLDGWTEGSPI